MQSVLTISRVSGQEVVIKGQIRHPGTKTRWVELLVRGAWDGETFFTGWPAQRKEVPAGQAVSFEYRFNMRWDPEKTRSLWSGELTIQDVGDGSVAFQNVRLVYTGEFQITPRFG